MCDDGRGMEEFSQCRKCSRVKVQNLDEVLVEKKKEEKRSKLIKSFHEQMIHQEEGYLQNENVEATIHNEENSIIIEVKEDNEEQKEKDYHNETNSNCIVIDERDLMLGILLDSSLSFNIAIIHSI